MSKTNIFLSVLIFLSGIILVLTVCSIIKSILYENSYIKKTGGVNYV